MMTIKDIQLLFFHICHVQDVFGNFKTNCEFQKIDFNENYEMDGIF